MDIVPYMCDIDHMSANLMNAKLLRKYTVASGFKICDYWYVGNKSEHIKE
ncbi:MAG: L-2-amino-thiazoline-4-carboxylic acid hydrolase [Lachnospiraceae bacterium]|nr:L-2-amino-thiazoline-4-carboxylic acid hydrolase [Lachnospiraceae bacterium]